METKPVERKLAVILAADVAGYSRLMSEDEMATLQALTEARRVVAPLIQSYRGRIFNTAGDSVVAEFPSVVDAVRCAADIQTLLNRHAAAKPPDRRLLFRIGINIGDVMVVEGNLLGDGVNIAARLEGLAEPGGVFVSRNVHEQIRAKLALDFEDLGPQQLKNIADPIQVFRLRLAEDGPVRAQVQSRKPQSRSAGSGRGRRALALAGVLVLLAAAGAGAYVYRQQEAARSLAAAVEKAKAEDEARRQAELVRQQTEAEAKAAEAGRQHALEEERAAAAARQQQVEQQRQAELARQKAAEETRRLDQAARAKAEESQKAAEAAQRQRVAEQQRASATQAAAAQASAAPHLAALARCQEE